MENTNESMKTLEKKFTTKIIKKQTEQEREEFQTKINNMFCFFEENKIKINQIVNKKTIDIIKNDENKEKKEILEGTGNIFYTKNEDNLSQKGRIQYNNNLIFEGELENGKIKDQQLGKLIQTEGNIMREYFGSFKDGKPNGVGSIYKPGDSYYTGEVKNGSIHGKGKIIYTYCLLYDGEFINGIKNGEGTLINSKYNWTYIGEFKNNLRNGNGILKRNNSIIYEGEWKDDKYDGKGRQSGKGYLYVGEFQKGKREGKGEIIINKTKKFIGEWKNDKRNGKFQVINLKNQMKYKTEFTNGYENWFFDFLVGKLPIENTDNSNE